MRYHRAWRLRVTAYSRDHRVKVHHKRCNVIPVSMQVGQKFTVFVTPVPPNGVLDAPPTYALVTGGIVTVTPAADGLSALVTAVAAGTDTVSVKDTSLGNPIAGDDVVTVTVAPVPVPATSLHVTVGSVS